MSTTIEHEKPAPSLVVEQPPLAPALPIAAVPVAEAGAAVPASRKQPVELPPPPARVGSIAIAIARIMQEVGTIPKDGYNKFHQYKFMKADDLIARVSPLMAAQGLVILQTEVDRVLFDGGNAVAIKYAFTLMHASGEVYPERLYQTGVSRCRDSKGGYDDKSFNKCHTAARKYMLIALFQVPTGDVDDADLDENRAPARHPTRTNHELSASVMKTDLETCRTVPELEATRIDIRDSDEFRSLPEDLQAVVQTAYNNTLKRLQTQVVHDSDQAEPRPATEEDFPDLPDTLRREGPAPAAPDRSPDSISSRASAAAGHRRST